MDQIEPSSAKMKPNIIALLISEDIGSNNGLMYDEDINFSQQLAGQNLRDFIIEIIEWLESTNAAQANSIFGNDTPKLIDQAEQGNQNATVELIKRLRMAEVSSDPVVSAMASQATQEVIKQYKNGATQKPKGPWQGIDPSAATMDIPKSSVPKAPKKPYRPQFAT